MTCLPQLSGWAYDILTSVGETGMATGQVVTWLKNNLGKLNIALESAYYVSGDTGSGCLRPNLGQAESGIYTEMYLCHYFTRKASENLGAMAYDSWVEIEGDNQGRIRRTSRNEIAKSYMSLAKECKSNPNELIKWYKDHSSGYTPQRS